MASIHANGAGVRHAIARALATANLSPHDAIFRLKRARIDLDSAGDVARADVSIELEPALPIAERRPESLRGLVNADGAHSLMAWLPGDPRTGTAPFFMDILAVSWSRWREQHDVPQPGNIDRYCPYLGASLEEARAFARAEGKRLPTAAEIRVAWGPHPLPWGEGADPSCGRVGRPRYDVVPEGGLHPPNPDGIFDLGAWLWQWLEDGTVAGGGPLGEEGGAPAEGRWPIGIRLVKDA